MFSTYCFTRWNVDGFGCSFSNEFVYQSYISKCTPGHYCIIASMRTITVELTSSQSISKSQINCTDWIMQIDTAALLMLLILGNSLVYIITIHVHIHYVHMCAHNMYTHVTVQALSLSLSHTHTHTHTHV